MEKVGIIQEKHQTEGANWEWHDCLQAGAMRRGVMVPECNWQEKLRVQCAQTKGLNSNSRQPQCILMMGAVHGNLGLVRMFLREISIITLAQLQSG